MLAHPFRVASHVLLIFSLVFSAGVSAASGPYKERSGARDHPLVSRFQGAILHNYGVMNFERIKVPLSATAEEAVEGKVHNFFYVAPAERSMLEVYRNYKAALEKSGFQIMVACEEERLCEKQQLDRFASELTYRADTWTGGSDAMSRIDRNGNYPPRFLAARLKRSAGDVVVTLLMRSPSSVQKDAGVGGPIFLQVIEVRPMETGNVTVRADALSKGLAAEGKIALYGIHFDTAKADIKPESKAQLDEMGKLLMAQKNLKVFIVGHTDSQGKLEENLALSQRRAEAIVAALVRDFKIDASRLQSRGLANFAPVASNANEAGRARNRRVELVEQ